MAVSGFVTVAIAGALGQSPAVDPASAANAFDGGSAYAVNDTKDRYRFALRKLDLRTG